MNQKIAWGIVFVMVVFMGAITVLSVAGDSLTMDELAHLPAGYSYLVKQDMRLNPEHPPLMKDLAAFPLLFIKNINFPENISAWKYDVNGQWDFGNRFLFHSNNPADTMIFWSRIPMIAVLLVGAIYTFLLGKDFFGIKAGILALFLYAFSPTLLAHGRYVTTDVPIAVGGIISFYYFLHFLKTPNKKTIILAGLALGLALLLKFTGVFLVPPFVFLTALWVWSRWEGKERLQMFWRYGIWLFLVFAIAGLSIYPVYQFHVLNYSPQRQFEDMTFILASHPIQLMRKILPPLAKIPVLRAFAQYLFGLAMVFERGVGGNTTYFMGEVSSLSWKTYFPILYLVKETLTLHILTLVGLISGGAGLLLSFVKRQENKKFITKAREIVRDRFAEWSLLCFVLLYWAITLSGNLNIGVRHLAPILPFTFLLVSRDISGDFLKGKAQKIKYGFVGALLLWQAVSVISVYPFFLTYYNEAVGGPSKGYLIAADSNLDWGQDVKRLQAWVEDNNLEKIYVDVFGGTDARYYLGDKMENWWGSRNPEEIPSGSYLAVSATFLQGGRGKPVHGFREPTDFYFWLDNHELVEVVGNSIFIYRIN